MDFIETLGSGGIWAYNNLEGTFSGGFLNCLGVCESGLALETNGLVVEWAINLPETITFDPATGVSTPELPSALLFSSGSLGLAAAAFLTWRNRVSPRARFT